MRAGGQHPGRHRTGGHRGPILSRLRSDGTGVGDDLNCPKCLGRIVRRSHRSGALERLLSLLYIYPFRCQSCGYRFLTLRWRRRYTRLREERREYERLPLSVPVMLSGLSGAAPGHATEISIDGCTVETEAPLSEGALVQVTLHVTPGAAPITVEAAVVHGVLPHGGGLHFVRIQPAERDRLRQFVAVARRALGGKPGSG